MTIIKQGQSADIGLLLEGTYPYVSGGVSSWVNQIIKGFPQYSFALCFIGSRAEDYGDMRYTLPDNVVHLEVHYLHESQSKPPVIKRKGNPQVFKEIRCLHDMYRQPERAHEQEASILDSIMQHRSAGRYAEADFLYSREAWDYITEQYREHCTDPSFVDYFWTLRQSAID